MLAAAAKLSALIKISCGNLIGIWYFSFGTLAWQFIFCTCSFKRGEIWYPVHSFTCVATHHRILAPLTGGGCLYSGSPGAAGAAPGQGSGQHGSRAADQWEESIRRIGQWGASITWSRRLGSSWPRLCVEAAEWTERSGGAETEDGEENIRELEQRLAPLGR